MIPTSIDGTDITGATIDGTDVQEITVDGDVVFSASDVPDSALLFYSAEENGGSTAVDRTNNNNDGTINGATFSFSSTSAVGQFAYEFNGNDNIFHPTLGIFDGSTSFYVGMWVYFEDLTSDYWAWSSWAEFDWSVNYDNAQNDFILRTFDGSTSKLTSFISNPQINTYYHILGGYDSNADEMRTFLNGALVDTESNISTPRSRSYDNTFGCRGFLGGDLFLDGYIDDAVIGNVAPTSSIANALYNR